MKNLWFIGAIIVVLVIGVAWWLGSDRPITNYPPQNSTIVAFGDSLVAGVGSTKGGDFVSQLSMSIGRPIINLGVSGNTTKDGVARMDEVIKQNPGVVILLLGGNDSLRRVDVAETRANLITLITGFQKQGAVVVLLGVRGGVIRDGRAEMYETLAHEYGAVYVPDVLDGILLTPELMADAIHPNNEGYAIIAERVAATFRDFEL